MRRDKVQEARDLAQAFHGRSGYAVAKQIVELLDEALDVPLCDRCGNPYGAGGHGPGFCPDRRQRAERIAADPYSPLD